MVVGLAAIGSVEDIVVWWMGVEVEAEFGVCGVGVEVIDWNEALGWCGEVEWLGCWHLKEKEKGNSQVACKDENLESEGEGSARWENENGSVVSIDECIVVDKEEGWPVPTNMLRW